MLFSNTVRNFIWICNGNFRNHISTYLWLMSTHHQLWLKLDIWFFWLVALGWYDGFRKFFMFAFQMVNEVSGVLPLQISTTSRSQAAWLVRRFFILKVLPDCTVQFAATINLEHHLIPLLSADVWNAQKTLWSLQIVYKTLFTCNREYITY